MEIKRDLYLNKLIESKHNGMIKVVTGVRRSGKSYLLFNLFYNHLKECGVAEDHIIRVDLDNLRDKSLYEPLNLLAHIDSQMKDKEMYYILLDEVQNVENFEGVLNSYLKIPNADVYATGSNSKFLSTDIVTEFRGRGDEVRVHPLCFREFMSAYQGNSREEALTEYINYGGLPQVAIERSVRKKREYLRNLFQTTYLKDIKNRHNIEDDANLEEMVYVLASSIGSLTNPLNLQHTFRSVDKSNISIEKINKYLAILSDAFILEKALRYDVKGRRYIGSPFKYYFEDLGLRNAILGFRQFDIGHLMENLLYNELRVRDFSVDVGQVEYNYKDSQGKSKRTNFEVDFVCNRDYNRCYIQSTFSMSTPEKTQQEFRSLLHIKDGFQKMVIVGGLTPTHQNDDGIYVVNIFNFLLDDDLPL